MSKSYSKFSPKIFCLFSLFLFFNSNLFYSYIYLPHTHPPHNYHVIHVIPLYTSKALKVAGEASGFETKPPRPWGLPQRFGRGGCRGGPLRGSLEPRGLHGAHYDNVAMSCVTCGVVWYNENMEAEASDSSSLTNQGSITEELHSELLERKELGGCKEVVGMV